MGTLLAVYNSSESQNMGIMHAHIRVIIHSCDRHSLTCVFVAVSRCLLLIQIRVPNLFDRELQASVMVIHLIERTMMAFPSH